MYDRLFTPYRIGSLTLKNRLTMAPLYLGYGEEGGKVSRLMIEHYRLMAKSGVALVVVENVAIDYQTGRGSARTLRVDTDDCLEGLREIAAIIQAEGALASLQLNHAGRFAEVEKPVAPSAVETFGRLPKALTTAEIRGIIAEFAEAAARVKKAGFDMVELHGGTGYLLAEFVSPRTNKRKDAYGGPLENRQRFPLEVLAAVKKAVGDFPVGYRFLADEWLPDGLNMDESCRFAGTLAPTGVAYLSVMGGTYESFRLPPIVEKSKRPGYMIDLSGAVKSVVKVPVIAAGRIATGDLAERVIAEGKADLIGLARVLWADPSWPEKVREGREAEIIHCDPDCDACTQVATKGKPAFCVRWPHGKMREWKEKSR
jgi:2,4-dienoyl-CoA reductase (NADPH2)